MHKYLLAMVIASVLSIGTVWPYSVQVQAADFLKEYQVKAAYVYNFSKYVDWPESLFKSKLSPFYICILGTDYFGKSINIYTDKKVKNHRISIKRMQLPEQLQLCHMVFISQSYQDDIKSLLEDLADQSFLTISDIEGFAQMGGMIELIKQETKVRFSINIDSARQAGLNISARLLKLATVVTGQ